MTATTKDDQEAPEPTAKVRYTGDGTRYVPGIPADPDVETEVPVSQAQGLADTGLFEIVAGKRAAARAAKEAEAAQPETAPQGEETPA